MDTLHPNWVTEGTLDFEYKKYLLLAYLQHCRERFGENRLYPPLAELVGHYRSLQDLRAGMEGIHDQFPKELTGLDMRRLEMNFESAVQPDEYISTITEIIDFALPSLHDAIREGRDIYEFVEQHLDFSPVGVEPIYRNEGFLLVHDESHPEVYIYSFRFGVIPNALEGMRGLELTYLYAERRSLANPIEAIKRNLSQRFREFPNPATFLCVSRLRVPIAETLLPVTKRIMMKRLAA